jgi:hypothetical protein
MCAAVRRGPRLFSAIVTQLVIHPHARARLPRLCSLTLNCQAVLGVTFSLPSSCSAVDAGRWGRSPAYEGPLRSVQGNAVAALSCCTTYFLRAAPVTTQRTNDDREVHGPYWPYSVSPPGWFLTCL